MWVRTAFLYVCILFSVNGGLVGWLQADKNKTRADALSTCSKQWSHVACTRTFGNMFGVFDLLCQEVARCEVDLYTYVYDVNSYMRHYTSILNNTATNKIWHTST